MAGVNRAAYEDSFVGRASRPAAGVHARLFHWAKSGSWRTRAQSKTQRNLLGNRRVWRPAAGVDARPTCFSSLFVGRRPILTDLEVRPTTFRSISRHWEKYAALGYSALRPELAAPTQGSRRCTLAL